MQEMYYYWLHNVSGIGRVTLNRILKYTTPEELYKSDMKNTAEFLTEKQRERIQESKKHWELQKKWEF